MNLRKIIKDIILEYIENNEIALKRYLSMSEEEQRSYLPHEYSEFFDDFVIETDSDFEKPTDTVSSNYVDGPDVEVDMFDNDNELMIWLEDNNKEVYDEFAKYLYNKIKYNELPINDADYPAWSYFDNSPVIVKNQWLIHFTDNAMGIAKNGFIHGVDDMTRLGLTTRLGTFDKKYGGYNFSYLLSDFNSYGKNRFGYKYGKEAVIFNASGIKVWHYGDEEPQVIFYGNTATNIIPIIDGENASFGIFDINDRLIYENDELDKVVNWVTKNFRQYRKRILFKQ